MNNSLKKLGFLGLLLVVPFVLVGCFGSTDDSPFEIEAGEIELTLEGTIRPFSVPVSSFITHRLERNNRLQAFLASDVLELEDYEKQSVLVTGVWRVEEAQKFFVVTEIEVLEKDKEEDDEGILEEYTSDTIYAPVNGGDYGFLFPDVWDYTSETEMKKRFFLREDEEKDVFFTFGVEPYDGSFEGEVLAYGEEEKKEEPKMNVEIAGLKGIKDVERKGAFEYQNIHLFSEETNRVYMFAFRAQTSNRDRKRAFNTLLTSLADGETELAELMDKYEADMEKRKEAEEPDVEEMKDGEDTEEPKEEEEIKVPEVEEQEDSEDESEIKEEEKVVSVDFTSVKGSSMDGIPTDFVMMVDDRSHSYTSAAYDLALRVPYTLWFRNFGSVGGSVTTLGFATDDSLTDAASSDFTLQIISGQPPVDFVVKKSDGMVRYEWARGDEQYFVMEGAESLKDHMLSIISTIE